MEEYAECFSYAKRQEKIETVKNILPVLEYASYKWNYLRVDEVNAHKFFKAWREEWDDLAIQGVSFIAESFKIGLYAWMIKYIPSFFENNYLSKKRH